MPSTYRLLVTFLSIVGLTLALTGVGHAGDNGQRERVIVALEEGENPHVTAREMAVRHDGEVGFVYEHALNGFSMEVPANSVRGIERDRRVRYVEHDQVAHAYSQDVPTGVQRIFADENAEIPIDGTDGHRVDVDVAVIDTGIDLDHEDLQVVSSTDCSGGSPFAGTCESGGDDDNGHGTHVAGTVGALDNGVGVVGTAPGARLHAVKVLRSDGSGYISWIVAGIDHVTANADTIEVANMSLGCECSSDSLDEAIAGSVDAGVAYAVAAGNSSSDVSTFSPANHPDVLTVSALADFNGEPGGGAAATCRDDQDDTFADFSNYGTGVEVIAPGVCIRSTWNDGGYNTISGTSMASPHAAGALGLLASGANDPTTQSEVEDLYSTVETSGNLDWDASDDPDEEHERLVDVGDSTVYDPTLVDHSGDDDTNSAPTASFTYSCTDLTCDFDGSGSSDSDGSISSYDWDFGDGTTGTGETVSHTYDSGGDYTVTLIVTDDNDATDSESQTVSVSSSDSSTTVTVSGAEPDTIGVGTADVTVTGSGFTEGASVALEDGKGHTPDVTSVTFISDSELSAEIRVEDKGPSSYWDVRITNPDGSSGVGDDLILVNR